MKEALARRWQAATEGEVPVGAVLVLNDKIIGQGWNRPITSHDPTAHAEIQALRQAAEHQGNYRLNGVEMYATPCVMCAGARLHARVAKHAFSAAATCASAAYAVSSASPIAILLTTTLQIVEQVLAAPCVALLEDFFRQRR